jgi:hypothetical protein
MMEILGGIMAVLFLIGVPFLFGCGVATNICHGMAAKKNGGYWSVNSLNGITTWHWGPDPNFKKPKPEPAPGTVIRKP